MPGYSQYHDIVLGSRGPNGVHASFLGCPCWFAACQSLGLVVARDAHPRFELGLPAGLDWNQGHGGVDHPA